MKKIAYMISAALLMAGFAGCESLRLGDAGLSKAPESSGATLDTLFASKKDADKVLVTAYWYLPYGIPSDFDSKMGGNMLESITDHFVSGKHTVTDGPNNLYYNGALGATIASDYDIGTEAYRFGSETDYKAIRYGWIFIENADRIPDASPAEIEQMKAQAKMCIAYAYANMFRYIGGVPLLDHSVTTTEDMSHYPRATFAETVDFIVRLCDEAAAVLPWYYASANDDGRMTKAAALGLKLRVLCFAASPTFNSDTKWHPEADEYTCYGNYSLERWKAAKDAADEFMKALNDEGHYALEQADELTNMGYRLAYRKGYFNRGSSECIISIRKSYSSSYHNELHDLNKDYPTGATLNWVNQYGWEDGTPFPEDFDWSNPPTQPFFKPDGTNTPPGTATRDPRLYENVCVPGDLWWDGTQGPAYSNHQHVAAGFPGFLQMKYILRDKVDRNNKPPHWCAMRLPEVLLCAAEAYNEYEGPSTTARGWVNQVRNRVGLCDVDAELDKEGLRKAIIRERDCEFGFEEVRWFDMVRWGLDDAFTKQLYGLVSKGSPADNALTFTFKVTELAKRSWQTEWDRKWFLAPIPTTEVNKGYGMTQNPGW